MKKAILALSGGMDSTALLIKLLAKEYEVMTLSFDYGQKHDLELRKANELRLYLNDKGFNIDYNLIDLKKITSLLKSNLIKGGEEVPEGHYQDDNMILTVVPNRNKIFSSILQAVALSQIENDPIIIAMGIHAGDHAIYPDCRQEFRDAAYEAFKLGNYNADRVKYYTPFLKWDKYQILKNAEDNCADLHLEFDEIFKRTNTSYKPIRTYYKDSNIWNGEYSDYKSASSIERIEAFIKLGRPDPIQYADKDGLKDWEYVKKYALAVLNRDEYAYL